MSGVATSGSGHQYVLKDLTLRIEPGQCIALVGPSGGGKTTIVSGFEGGKRGSNRG